MTKPFSVEALVARVRAVLRRTARVASGDGPADDAAMLAVGDLELDEEHWVVRRGGTQVELSPTEFRLLAYLMRNQGRMLTRQQLLENVWGWESPASPRSWRRTSATCAVSSTRSGRR